VNEKDYRVNRNEDTLYQYKRDATKYDWFMPFIIPGYNPDDGVHFGIGFMYKKQKWGKAPFGWEQSVRIEYATQSGFSVLAIRDYSDMFLANGTWILLPCTGDQSLYLIIMVAATKLN
jgi:hypothetical protein